MSPKAIAYPISFLERPEDRLFLTLLREKGVVTAVGKLLLYRIWADFGTAGSDRRRVCLDPAMLAGDRQVLILEEFCGWTGKPGELVEVATDAGFLVHESGDGCGMLVCKDFFPINSGWSGGGRSFQRKGAYARASKRQLREAEVAVGRELELMSRTKVKFEGIPDDRRTEVLILIHRICRAMNITVPDHGALQAGLFQSAMAVMDGSSSKAIDEVLLWLISKRDDLAVPKRLDGILSGWVKLEEQAKQETT